jgi:4-amino-4-deoxy-L-arabinose transferase-like glycosyltransferase
LIAWLLLEPRRREYLPRFARAVEGRHHLAVAGALGIGALTIAASLRYGSTVASGADSYGYISLAEMFAGGSLTRPPVTLPPWPWPEAAWTFAPLGWLPAREGLALVPTYPPGLPLLMALAHVLVAPAAKYVIVPLAAAAAVIATFVLGRRVAGSAAGLLSALLLAVSPAFLFHSFLQMSDVPATAAFAIALVLCFVESPRAPLASGVFAGLGVLIRPNLAPLAIALAAMVAIRTRCDGKRPAWHAVALFLTGALPTVLLSGWLYAVWFGSPFASGYGSLDSIFAGRYLIETATAYPRWLLETQTAFIFIGLAAPFVLGEARPSSSFEAVRGTRRLDTWLMLGFIGAVVASYALYPTFDDWGSLRFLLPAYPPLLVLGVAVSLVWLRAVPRFVRPAAGAMLFGTVALLCWHEATVRRAFVNWESLERFAEVPLVLRDRLPANAVYLTRIYSGSLIYYGQRPTVRWDVLSPDWLDRAIEELERRGLMPFIVIEGSEEDIWFRDRFAGANRWGALDWPPALEYAGIEWVRVYNPRDRQASVAGEHVLTMRVPARPPRR